MGPREGILLWPNLGHAIVTNGDFTAYVCDSAATRPSSQINLGKLVIINAPTQERCQTTIMSHCHAVDHALLLAWLYVGTIGSMMQQ